ncbi:hypothetical protein STEG23_034951, partial [Scotinomys teguina]
DCGGLNKNGHHRLIDLDISSPESGTIKSCGLVGVGAALLEEECHCGQGWEKVEQRDPKEREYPLPSAVNPNQTGSANLEECIVEVGTTITPIGSIGGTVFEGSEDMALLEETEFLCEALAVLELTL